MMAVGRVRYGMYFSSISNPAAAIIRCVCVDALAIPSGPWNPDPVVFARHWREIANDHSQLVRIASATDIGNDAFSRIRHVDPLKAIGVAI